MIRESFACAVHKAHPWQGVGLKFALLAMLLSSSATAADEVPPGQAVVVRLDGKTATGPLLAFDANGVTTAALSPPETQ